MQQFSRKRPIKMTNLFTSSYPAQSKASTALSAFAVSTGVALGTFSLFAEELSVDYDAVRRDIADILDQEDHDDGSLGPILVRLAWHTSGTYDKCTNTGGSTGSRMRWAPECKWDANAGLHVARQALEPIKRNHPGISYSDLWTLAAVVAIEEMGGPKVPWRAGRKDAVDAKDTVEDGRLPDGDKGAAHLRTIFYKMGFNDQEIVALAGAHGLGRCHLQNSGWELPWTRAPITFSNEFYRELIENKWHLRKWNGPPMFVDPTEEIMMLPADMCLIEDPDFKKWVNVYHKDEERFFKDFAAAFQKLEELGCEFNDQDSFTPFVALVAMVGYAFFRGA